MKKNLVYTVEAVVGVVLLAFTYYAISSPFINIKLDEALPETGQMESKAMEKSQVQAVSVPIIGTPVSNLFALL